MNMNTDKVWVGNLGAYNEGRLVGDWLELPYDEGSLGGWLREHVGIGKPRCDGGTYEEYEVFDTDFDGDLCRIGTQARDLSHLRLPQLNALARIAAELDEAQMDAAMACIEANGLGQALEAANAMLQADDISFTPFPQYKPARHCYNSDARALYWSEAITDLVSFALSDETLMEYIDPRKVGEEEEQYGVFGNGVFVDTTDSDTPDEMDREDIIDAAETTGTLTARRHEGEDLEGLAEEARAFLKDHSLLPSYAYKDVDKLLEEDPELGIACADVIANVEVFCDVAPEAVAAWWDAEASETSPKALAELVLQADKLAYTELVGERKWGEDVDEANIRRLGETVIEQRVDTFSRQELMEYFDGERYAQDLLDGGEFTVTEHGVLDNGATDADLKKYSWDEVIEVSREIADEMASSIDPSEPEESAATFLESNEPQVEDGDAR